MPISWAAISTAAQPPWDSFSCARRRSFIRLRSKDCICARLRPRPAAASTACAVISRLAEPYEISPELHSDVLENSDPAPRRSSDIRPKCLRREKVSRASSSVCSLSANQRRDGPRQLRRDGSGQRSLERRPGPAAASFWRRVRRSPRRLFPEHWAVTSISAPRMRRSLRSQTLAVLAQP
jgi:hypothetical protein